MRKSLDEHPDGRLIYATAYQGLIFVPLDAQSLFLTSTVIYRDRPRFLPFSGHKNRSRLAPKSQDEPVPDWIQQLVQNSLGSNYPTEPSIPSEIYRSDEPSEKIAQRVPPSELTHPPQESIRKLSRRNTRDNPKDSGRREAKGKKRKCSGITSEDFPLKDLGILSPVDARVGDDTTDITALTPHGHVAQNIIVDEDAHGGAFGPKLSATSQKAVSKAAKILAEVTQKPVVKPQVDSRTQHSLGSTAMTKSPHIKTNTGGNSTVLDRILGLNEILNGHVS